jgi:high-affinity iron transporter
VEKERRALIPTFVIGLREGLEAALIVGIIAAFLIQRGERRGLRSMWAGVGIAVVLCSLVAIGLAIVDSRLPFKTKETAEGVLSLVAVAGVTYMIVWMRRHARELKGHLESQAAAAIVTGSALGLAVMAFFAVLREGLETAIFMLAAFSNTRDPLSAGIGALTGVAVAIGLGWLIYKGGVKINLARFFKVTGVVLVLVAAGLLSYAVHEFAEAGLVSVGQDTAIDLSWLIAPDTIRASLITGMLGLQPVPTVAEVIVWLAYAVPMTAYVLWPPRRRVRREAPLEAAAA